jgi:hypothetical protein
VLVGYPTFMTPRKLEPAHWQMRAMVRVYTVMCANVVAWGFTPPPARWLRARRRCCLGAGLVNFNLKLK